MATERLFVCEKNGHEEWPSHLFEALRECAAGKIRKCATCDSEMYLRLTYDFGLDAGKHVGRVLDVFLPDPEIIAEWLRESGATVQFYPFLVMVKAIEEGYTSAWFPYWHIETHEGQIKRKYGQWAPFMGEDMLASLVKQARAKGYCI